ncbi:MAG: Re/Si-specific NAD(P)(+) transhydrogenase subunit alpha [bacterium]|jgi:NAD(P) transhydrogenase subunit alpha|nr:Re/Si-specific NAD(P)(+) transhydrogenase subunit alpha [bacterium]
MKTQDMPLSIGVPQETFPGEHRVALTPDVLPSLLKAGFEVHIQAGAGFAAGFRDADYEAKGAKIVPDRAAVFASDLILQVRGYGANPEAGQADLECLKAGQTVIAAMEPLSEPSRIAALAKTGVNAFAMELIPRITRAQSMDILSSMASIAGYKAVLLAAAALPKQFPMMMTAAGTISPAKVLVVGAGVAGLQAIATAHRLGAVVSGYDVRPAVKEQVLSLGARFVELELETTSAEDKGGYAQAQDEAFYEKQRALMKKVVADSDVVITTAAVPGKKAPVLVTRDMVEGMHPGAVIVDLAAERGGNCELTQAGQTVVHQGVSILGPINLASTVPFDASRMYAKNMTTFLLNMVKEKQLRFSTDDEIVRETLVTADGAVVHPRILELLGTSPAS